MDQEKFMLPLELQNNGQENPRICWYACYKMMYAWKNKSVYELDQKLAAAGYDLTEIKKHGVFSDEYRKMARAVGTRDVLRSSALNWTLEDIIDRLQRWGPMFLSTMELGGHAVVLYGASIKFNYLIVADPNTVEDYKSAHNEYYTLNKFRGTIQPVDYAIQVF